MEENKYLYNIEDVNLSDELIKSFNLKPKSAIYMSFLIALVCAFTSLWPLSVIIVPVGLFALIKLPDRKVIDVFNDYIVIYNRLDKEHVQKVDYKDIKTWRIKQGGPDGDVIMFQMFDNEVVTASLFTSFKLLKILNKIMPEKEASYQRRKEMEKNSTPFRFNFFKKKKGNK